MRDLGVKREDVIIATKVRGRMGPGPNAVGLSRGHIMDQVAASLKRLGLDHIDLYQVHSFDPVTPLEETLRALDDCVSRGFVRTIGCSNFAAWQIMKALGISDKRGYARFETVQAYYSIAGRDLEREIVPLVEDQGLGVMVWSPLAGGFLSGKFTRDKRGDNNSRRTTFDFPPVDKERAYDVIDAMEKVGKAHGVSVARIALAWLLQRKGVMSVIIGAKTIEQLDDNLAAAELTLSPEEIAALDAASALEARISRLDADADRRGARSGGEGEASWPSAGDERYWRGEGRDAQGEVGGARRREDRRREGHPGDAAGRGVAHRGDRLARSRQGARRRQTSLASIARSAPTRSCSPTARSRPSTIRCPMSCMCLGRFGRSRPASMCCARSRSRSTPRKARSLIAARDRSGKLVAEAFMVRYHPQWRRAKELAQAGTVGEPRAIQTFFSYHLLDPENVRNRPPGGGALYDIGCYAILSARYIFGAEPTRVAATIDRDPNFRTDRLVGGLLEFPGGRHSTFTLATQMSAHQRVTIVGEAGRIEIMIPFNAPPDRPTEIAIDTGADLFGGGRRVEQFPICDQYTLQGDAFSRAIIERDAARIPDGGRSLEHARHRRPVPLGQKRIVGEAVSAGARLRLPASNQTGAAARPAAKRVWVRFGFIWVCLDLLGFVWISLELLGLIRPNRDFSMGYSDSK